MNSATKNTKTTLTTVKSFIRKNADRLYVNTLSSFDGMEDGVRDNKDAGFFAVDAEKLDFTKSYTLGINGVWFVGSSRDYFNSYFKNGFTGYQVCNCCGTFVVAVRANA